MAGHNFHLPLYSIDNTGAVGYKMEGSTHKQQADFPRSALECHICLAPPTNPVVTSCGHLFCWPCMYRWLQDRPKPCPVCRAMVRKDINIIPIYGSHEEGSKDAGHSGDPDQGAASDGVIPPRPKPPTHSIPITIDVRSDQIISMDVTSDQIINGSIMAATTLMEINNVNGRVLRAALETERARVDMLRRERRHLTASLNYLRRRNYGLIRRQGEDQAFLNSVRARVARFEEQLVASQVDHHLQ